ncbi:MAG TPA: prolyl oligopeptidase family serine peptidase [Gemmatimonadaceae bacterium]|nr:prolyl oligopeptidase family serine peptidase [Gemmatimonadaceae bacterium]
MNALRPRLTVLVAALLIAPAAAAPQARQADARLAARTADSTGADTLRPAAARQLTSADLRGWRVIRNTSLSNDGRWFAYLLAPNEGDAEVVIRPTGEGDEKRFPVGQPSAASVELSADGRWAAFTISPTEREQRTLRRNRRPVQNKVGVVDLATGEKREFDKVRRFAFNGDRPTVIALLGYGPESPPGQTRGPEASDLLVVDLASGSVLGIGNVSDFGFDRSGQWLAWTVDARDRLGNAIQIRDLRSGIVRSLDSEKALYRRMTWSDSLPAIAALRGHVDSAGRDTTYALVAFRSVAGNAAKSVYDAQTDSAFPAGMRISPDRALVWSEDAGAVYFGIRAKTPPGPARGSDSTATDSTDAPRAPARRGPNADEDPLPNMMIWHWKDPRLQSQQQVEENRDKTFSFLAAYRLGEQRFIRLADSTLRDVAASPRTRWTLGSDNRDYERDGNLDGKRYRDVWVVDQHSGERRKVLERTWGPQSLSPDGSRLLYWNDGHYHVHDIAAGSSRNITDGVPTSFVNVESDVNLDRPAIPPFGWASDGRSVLLSDRWDVWNVPVRAGRAVNLTVDGRERGIRYQRRLVFDPRERGVDLRKPLLLAAYGERTKQEAVARVEPGRPGARLVMTDDARRSFQKARDAETYLFTRQTVRDFPDYWVSDARFASPRRLTDANPQQRDFAWSAGARLVDYVSDRGDTLQAALHLPANYEPGKKYPAVVYIYERLSQNLHSYSIPNETRALNPSVYTSLGYAVLQPDIVYRVNDPGMSAVWSVLPAVRAAIATGVIDETNVGLHGHSWGGYQTAFLVTQTNLFKAAVAGAALTDLVSMYSSVYWNSGSANQPIFESSQGRFSGHFLENTEAYIRNSPAYHADKVTTPLLLLHNDKDGAVDFNQGITFYNTLRRLGKDVVMLQYVGENHGLRQPENQKDYAVRMREFFDHHLRGKPAPDWLTDGVPRLKLEEHLRARKPAAGQPAPRAEIVPE